MAAPPRDQPVTVTIGTVWRLQVGPPPRRPPILPVGAFIIWAIFAVSRVIFGVVYFKDCPQQPNIPNYLLGLGLTVPLMMCFMTLPCESFAAQNRENPTGFKACLGLLLCLFFFIWVILGDVWVFSVYQPNYDASAPDGLYCNKTLYTFAFWTAVIETFGFGVQLAKICRGMLVFVNLSPTPEYADGNAHSHSRV